MSVHDLLGPAAVQFPPWPPLNILLELQQAVARRNAVILTKFV